jgi:hypothetical protein
MRSAKFSRSYLAMPILSTNPLCPLLIRLVGWLLFAMGVEAATVQRILRHSSISVTTGTYVDVIEPVQRAAVAGMDSLLNPAQ